MKTLPELRAEANAAKAALSKALREDREKAEALKKAQEMARIEALLVEEKAKIEAEEAKFQSIVGCTIVSVEHIGTTLTLNDGRILEYEATWAEDIILTIKEPNT